MTVAELMARLASYPSDMEVCILDSFNGGGSPRTLNLGPVEHTISPVDEEHTADCEDRTGDTVLVLGFGCY